MFLEIKRLLESGKSGVSPDGWRRRFVLLCVKRMMTLPFTFPSWVLALFDGVSSGLQEPLAPFQALDTTTIRRALLAQMRYVAAFSNNILGSEASTFGGIGSRTVASKVHGRGCTGQLGSLPLHLFRN